MAGMAVDIQIPHFSWHGFQVTAPSAAFIYKLKYNRNSPGCESDPEGNFKAFLVL